MIKTHVIVITYETIPTNQGELIAAHDGLGCQVVSCNEVTVFVSLHSQQLQSLKNKMRSNVRVMLCVQAPPCIRVLDYLYANILDLHHFMGQIFQNMGHHLGSR